MMKSKRSIAAVLSGAMFAIGAAAWADDDRGSGGGQPNDSLPVYLDRSAHPTAEDSSTPGFIWQGAGNPNSTFQRKRNPDAGIELALKGIIRQGPDIRSTYVDGNGLVHIEVPAGAQPTNPGRAAWNFTYSYNVALDPANPDLTDYEGRLWIDLDPSDRARYLKLELTDGGPVQPVPALEPDRNGYQWTANGTVVILDDEGTRKVTQNSQNYAFYRLLIDTDRKTPGVQPYNYGPAEFDVVMALRKKSQGHHDKDDHDFGRGRWTILHVVFDVVNAPTQTP